ncbi:hypothetical protein [Bifidobacterium sp. SO4]|uniref:hypothetical protein n=1 Tax=Bifidobacterium sp. SO4 TaxID=2809030 RepID=UPI001BDD188B|nr:hypothetical protein [Bifidobacterium sp. SO4]MBT1169582.1 hypothetical protein [Bifidobacterium sp. SO4]
MRVVAGDVRALVKSPVAFAGVLLAVAATVVVPVLWWKADRLLWWVIIGLAWLAGLLLAGLFVPKAEAARDGVASLVFVGEAVFAVLFGVIGFVSKVGGRLAYALAPLVLVLAVLGLKAVASGAGASVRKAAVWPLVAPFLLVVDRVPAGDNWMTIHLPLLLAVAVWLVQAGQVWDALVDVPVVSEGVRGRHGGDSR